MKVFMVVLCVCMCGVALGCRAQTSPDTMQEEVVAKPPVETSGKGDEPVAVEPPKEPALQEGVNEQDMARNEASDADMDMAADAGESDAPKVTRSLDKQIIRRAVKKHRDEILYCYEKQLQKDPELAGVVKVKFVISGTGSVASAEVTSTSLNNAEVEECMLESIRQWVFPAPTGGGIVNVNYPFAFSIR